MYIPSEPVISPRDFLKESRGHSFILSYHSYNPIFCPNGRSALYLALKLSKLSAGDTALLPSYLCPSIVNVFKRFRLNLKFYRVFENLEIDFNNLMAMTAKAKVMLIIHYFGLPQPIEKIIRFCKEKKILLIEDCAQALFSKSGERYLGTFGDYGFFSLRKSLALPDGGMLIVSDRIVKPNLTDSYTQDNGDAHFFNIFSLLIKYMEVKLGITPRTFIKRSVNIRKRYIEHDSRRKIDIKNGISRLSSKLLGRTEENEIVEKRRNNYIYLYENLKGFTNLKIYYPFLPDGSCPLCFPVLTSNRDRIRIELLKRGIDLRAFWDILPDEISALDCPVSHKVAEEILLLPVHQNLQKKHLDYILFSLREVKSKLSKQGK